ncbi:MAG: anti-sigma factor antagonist [Chthoniobacter sp.]|jgi:anti-sigma B factor antagonist|nr:anti-sigma factor antagonist [Chthoniobacter sp.]
MAHILEAEINDGTLHIAVTAYRLDATTARDFKKDCASLWQPSIRRITVDLGRVEFLDSVGVGALLTLYKRLPSENPSFKLLRARPAVQSIIGLLRLNRIFEIDEGSGH